MAEISDSLRRKRRSRRKDRLSTTSSEGSIFSPDGKKARNADTSLLEQEKPLDSDDILTALNMTEEFSHKLDEILNKLSKLDAIQESVTKIDRTLAKLEERTKSLENFKITAIKDVEDLKQCYSFMGSQFSESSNNLIQKQEEHRKKMEELQMMQRGYDGKLEELNTKDLYLESYTRRENIKFMKIEEDEGREDTEEVLRSFLENELGFMDARSVEIQRVHRIGKRRGTEPRPILARFLRYKDCEVILSMGRRLRETDYQMFMDLPSEIIKRRREQMDTFRKARLHNIPAYFSRSQPDKLYVKGKFWPIGKDFDTETTTY